MKKYNNPYKKHIPCDEMVWAELREIKRGIGLHSINEVLKQLIKNYKGI